MKTVIFHRYAQMTGTNIFTSKSGSLKATLRPNAWIGILEESEDWYKIVSARTDGWIKKRDSVEGCHFDLTPALTVNMHSPAQGYRLSDSETGICTCSVHVNRVTLRDKLRKKYAQVIEDMFVTLLPYLRNVSDF